ncbi:MAG TPA: fasciclin domain-containing protein [Puia sp.]
MIKLFARTGLYISLASLSILFFWACNKSTPAGTITQTSSLGYIIANGANTTIFNSAVVKAGLDTVFSGPSIFTLLVPNDDACIQSGYSQTVINGFTQDQARNWVLYQTYAGTALNFESFIGKTEVKLIMADGDSVFVSGDSNRTYVNGYQFLNTEVTAINGVMLALQNVLFPPQQNLAQMVGGDTSLSFFNQAIQLATPVPDSLSSLLSTGGPFTLYAPDNDAFRNLGYNSPTDLNMVNPDTLRSIVLSGLIPQRLFNYDVEDSSTFKTVSDSTLIFYTIGIQTTVQVVGSDTTSNIISINQMAINGVLFKIDGLLEH